jgi:hypothetical protein
MKKGMKLDFDLESNFYQNYKNSLIYVFRIKFHLIIENYNYILCAFLLRNSI